MNGFITHRIINPKFQLVHPGKLAENQLARSQNLLVTDERTSVKIFTDAVGVFIDVFLVTCIFEKGVGGR